MKFSYFYRVENIFLILWNPMCDNDREEFCANNSKLDEIFVQ